MSFNYYVRNPAGTSIPVSLKMKQDCWLSTPRSRSLICGPQLLLSCHFSSCPFPAIAAAISLCLEHTFMCTCHSRVTKIPDALQFCKGSKKKNQKNPAKPVITIEGSYGSSITYLHGQEANLPRCRYSQ